MFVATVVVGPMRTASNDRDPGSGKKDLSAQLAFLAFELVPAVACLDLGGRLEIGACTPLNLESVR
jgi:hypothetical protein